MTFFYTPNVSKFIGSMFKPLIVEECRANDKVLQELIKKYDATTETMDLYPNIVHAVIITQQLSQLKNFVDNLTDPIPPFDDCVQNLIPGYVLDFVYFLQDFVAKTEPDAPHALIQYGFAYEKFLDFEKKNNNPKYDSLLFKFCQLLKAGKFEEAHNMKMCLNPKYFSPLLEFIPKD